VFPDYHIECWLHFFTTVCTSWDYFNLADYKKEKKPNQSKMIQMSLSLCSFFLGSIEQYFLHN